MDPFDVPLELPPRPAAARWDERTRPSRRVAAGELHRLRRAVHVDRARWQNADARERTVLFARAAQATATTTLTFSHETATVLHGLPLLDAPAHPLTCIALDGIRRSRHGIRWVTPRHPRDVETVEHRGLRLTSARQTALHLMLTGSMAQGFIVLDAFRARATPSDLEWLTGSVRGRRGSAGSARAETILRAATGLAESPLESLSLLRMHQLGFEPPQQQVAIATDAGGFLVDFWWPGARIIGEADGRAKYSMAGSAAAMEKALWKEKRREDALRAVTSGFARWSWSDARHSVALERALSRAGVPRR